MRAGELELGERATLVLDCVDLIPEGVVASYGDIAALVGTGPRQVGRIMSTHGHLTFWWRVVCADGGSQVAGRALEHWDREEISYRDADNPRVDMASHRISDERCSEIAAALADRYAENTCGKHLR
ncbi:MGMT family protein [Corynebacterium pacaense]|uniref:MGMT family protein n=1 Tax=Corynebacterium pacaense TaxID=1816684 RepID=UPI0009B9A86B|nr:MGMT family protein [Corynebacterium pacaense]